ncbi:hypothetical protein B0H63DRAFT_191835 [Podospora didyma]|uniref:Uncharacterized protein n=1 Tax=Podospora didyma TaxID=330526 RepID=A0AAE0NR16_9PEZI|nr:hypothetical protein B0H63DRAFT_191835 [Podospora didyma]
MGQHHSQPTKTRYPTERESDYSPCGLHPIHIGDTFVSPSRRHRYVVVHKLDHSPLGLSTSWLVRDFTESKWRRLTVVSAQASQFYYLEFCRVDLGEGMKRDDEHACANCRGVDYFLIDGPNGKHVGLVFPLEGTRGGFLRDDFCEGDILRAWKKRFPEEAKGVVSVHGLTSEQILRLIGEPRKVFCQRKGLDEKDESRPKYLVEMALLEVPVGGKKNEKVPSDRL